MTPVAVATRIAKSGFGLGPLLIALIRVYQTLFAGLLPRACRFEPSCSVYAVQALSSRAVLPALYLIVRRLLRCHPFHPGGYDPLP